MATKSLFISHISEEADIAGLMKEMIQQDFLGLATCFASSDIGSIGAGENWLTAIKDAMSKAKAVIVLCSKASVHRPWVQFEVGAAWMKGVRIIPVCHSGMKVDELQMPLSLHQGLELGSRQGLTKLYDGIAQTLKTGRPKLTDLLERFRRINEIEERFRLSQIQQFELFIDIILPPPGRLETETIPADTPVELGDTTLELFGFLSGTGLTWGKVVKAAEKTPDRRWLRQLQRCIYLASNNERFRPVQAVYHTESGSYQPQLSKREVHTDGTTRFHVHFVDTVVAPLTDVQNDFGVLATLLRLGLRFRYEVIERFRKLERPIRGQAPAPNVSEGTMKQLRDAIEVIENDALSRGAEKMDRDAVMALFEKDDDHDTMDKVQESWDGSRALLFRDAPPLSMPEVIDVLKRMRCLNYHFMKIGTRRFHEMVSTRWDGAEIAPKGRTAKPIRSRNPAKRRRIADPAPAP